MEIKYNLSNHNPKPVIFVLILIMTSALSSFAQFDKINSIDLRHKLDELLGAPQNCQFEYHDAKPRSNRSKRSMSGNGYVDGAFEPYVFDLAQDSIMYITFKTNFQNVDTVLIELHSYFDDKAVDQNGLTIDTFILLDNGMGNDDVAGDSIFSSNSMYLDSSYREFLHHPFGLNRSLGFQNIGIFYTTYIFSNNTTEYYEFDPGLQWRWINSDRMNISPEITVVDSSFQYTSHIVNFVLDTNMPILSNMYGETYELIDDWQLTRRFCKRFYEHFPDAVDFLILASTYPSFGAVATHYGIRQEETGVFYYSDPYDSTQVYYSQGRLQSIIRLKIQGNMYPGTIGHEILHRWGMQLPESLELNDYGQHWDYNMFPSSGFFSGKQYSQFIPTDTLQDTVCYQIYNNGIYWTNAYNTLELYLMGLIPIDSVNWPIKTLIDPYSYSGWICADSGLVEISKTQFLNLMPQREPAFPNTQHNFTCANIVISDRMLTPKELSYYHEAAIQYELPIHSPLRDSSLFNPVWLGTMSALNFNEATGGRGTMRTKLPLVCDSIDYQIHITDNPIPSGLYRASERVWSSSLVQADSIVEFQSATEIDLEPQFEVKPGGTFDAKINPCGPD